MKRVLAVASRVLAVLIGGVLVYVQLAQFPKLPLPNNGEAVGFDLAWIAILAVAVWLLFYGFGLLPRSKKVEIPS